MITRHGTPVARLGPCAKPDGGRTRRAISRLKAARKGGRLDGLAWEELRDARRR